MMTIQMTKKVMTQVVMTTTTTKKKMRQLKIIQKFNSNNRIIINILPFLNPLDIFIKRTKMSAPAPTRTSP